MATGLAFLLPTLVLVTVFSALYFQYGSLPGVEGLFWGLKPAILAVILAAGWKLAKTALGIPEAPNAFLFILAVGGILAVAFLDRMEVPAMVLGGILSWLVFRSGPPDGTPSVGPSATDTPAAGPPAAGPPTAGPPTPAGESEGSKSGNQARGLIFPVLAAPGTAAAGFLPALGSLGHIFLLMFGAGAVLFGGGYMLVALLEPFVVGAYGWLTPEQFLDGIALTQAVPGPIVTLVAFVGFAVAGVPGAVVATAGIYLPSFAAVLAVAPHLEKWRHAEGFRAALRGVNAVVAGAILGVGFTLLPPAVPDPWAGGLFLVALLALVRWKAPAVWIVAGGLIAGGIHLLLVR